MATEFGGGVIRNEQTIGTHGLGRLWQSLEIVLPEPMGAPASEFVRHQADRRRPFARWRVELEVREDDLAELVGTEPDHNRPRSL